MKKKLYTLTFGALLAATTMVNGQEKITVNIPINEMEFKTNAVESNWLNYALQLINDDIRNGIKPKAQGSLLQLFPDSIIQVGHDITGAIRRPDVHKAATILDPKNMPFLWLNQNSSYTLDSLAIAYAYVRNTVAKTSDTLIINIIKDDKFLVLNVNSLPPRLPYTYQDIMYDYLTNEVRPLQNLTTIKYALTELDSTTKRAGVFNIKNLLLKMPMIAEQKNGARIGAVLTFKPGYTYTSKDSIQAKNSFYLASYEQNGPSSNPRFNGIFADSTSDLNCSYVLPTAVRYNTAKSWNGFFIPTWEEPTTFSAENHAISFKLTSTTVGIKEENIMNGMQLFQNQPNPTNGATVINYNLNQITNITLLVYDITGKKVFESNQGKQAEGKHNINLEQGQLKSGIYFYTLLSNEGNSLTKKMIVTE